MHLHFRSLFISDTHLGGRNLKSDQLLDFLQKKESEYLYLVGDIFDIVKLKKKWSWPATNDEIINLILQKAKNGTNVVYLPGNHDIHFSNYSGANFNGIQICTEAIHESADGGRFLVTHGDKFDCVVQNSRWLANIGSILYEALLILNRWCNSIRLSRGKNEIITSGPPVFMYVGRVAVEKNIEAFLQLDLPGSKYVVGDGPARNTLSRKYRRFVSLVFELVRS